MESELAEPQLIAALARRHYLEDVSKVQLAKEFGISRFRIARLLAKGRDEGIIRLEIIDPSTDLPTLSEPLASHLGLRYVRVIGSNGTDTDVRTQLGLMGAQLLGELVKPGDNVGLGWGRTVAEVAKNLRNLPPVTVIQICGAVAAPHTPSPIDNIREAVANANGYIHDLPVPFFVRSPEMRRQLFETHSYVRGQFEHLDTALVSIGSWEHKETQLYRELPPSVRARLDQVRPAGELAGIWYDRTGRVLAPEVTRMCMTLETHHLSQTPRVIAVAAGVKKVSAILGAARTGLITGLVTDRDTAEALLEST